jgi:hypothetical protein
MGLLPKLENDVACRNYFRNNWVYLTGLTHYHYLSLDDESILEKWDVCFYRIGSVKRIGKAWVCLDNEAGKCRSVKVMALDTYMGGHQEAWNGQGASHYGLQRVTPGDITAVGV